MASKKNHLSFRGWCLSLSNGYCVVSWNSQSKLPFITYLGCHIQPRLLHSILSLNTYGGYFICKFFHCKLRWFEILLDLCKRNTLIGTTANACHFVILLQRYCNKQTIGWDLIKDSRSDVFLLDNPCNKIFTNRTYCLAILIQHFHCLWLVNQSTHHMVMLISIVTLESSCVTMWRLTITSVEVGNRRYPITCIK